MPKLTTQQSLRSISRFSASQQPMDFLLTSVGPSWTEQQISSNLMSLSSAITSQSFAVNVAREMNYVVSLIFVCLFIQQVAAVSVCKQSELGSLLTNPNTTACASDSGVVFADLNGAPSDEQLTSICETDSCLSLMAAILAIDPEDCTLALNENLNLMSELVDPVVEKCTSLGIDIAGGSRVGSDSGVNVGDEDSATSDSKASGSSSASTLITTSMAAIALTLLAMM